MPGGRRGPAVAGLALAALLLASLALAAEKRQVTDAAGRRVEVPVRIERVDAAGVPASILLYTLAPEKMVGWTRPLTADPAVLIGLVPLHLLRWRMNVMTLAEEEAQALGVDTLRMRLVIIAAATLMTSAAVSRPCSRAGHRGAAVPRFHCTPSCLPSVGAPLAAPPRMTMPAPALAATPMIASCSRSTAE